MGGASARQLQSRCKMFSCFCKSRKMYIQLRVPTYNHNYFVLHCCFGFSASTRNDVTARASSWLVNAAWISAKVQIFQLALNAWMAHQTFNSRRAIPATSFVRIAPQDCLLRLCIDLTCKSFYMLNHRILHAIRVIRVWCERTFRVWTLFTVTLWQGYSCVCYKAWTFRNCSISRMWWERSHPQYPHRPHQISTVRCISSHVSHTQVLPRYDRFPSIAGFPPS